MSIFHLAFHVRDLDEARRFYGGDPFGNPIEAKGFRSLATVYDT
jgi:extradiol dioxygenase family protein